MDSTISEVLDYLIHFLLNTWLFRHILMLTDAVQPEEADELPLKDQTTEVEMKSLADDEVDNGFSYREPRSHISSEQSQSIQSKVILNKLCCIP